ncbi:hypothetical protein [uncultured Photobacterium sp.]|uniref:hypothetical protein n=1 Tax=uncultured Photobacterium sp. TaxID=173973 RepID=UPI00260A0F5F|nr:hypothetical protein [uncultured Photobacterium sp.]
MRKTNLMLIAALVASPLALADDHGYGYYEHDGDLVIDNSGNLYLDKNAEFTATKDIYKKNVGNEDNDTLKLDNVGNLHKVVKEDNKEVDNSFEKDLDYELNKYLADSKLYGHVMGTSVTYGGACCGGNASPTDILVNQDNMMNRVFGDASGINVAGQNVGNNSLVQQNSSTNAALVGSGGDAVGGVGSGY